MYTFTALMFLTGCSNVVVKNDNRSLSIKQAAQEMKDYNVIYFGERHDSKIIHESQEKFFKELYKNNNNFSLGLEMVQKDYQDVLDRYLEDENMNEKDLEEILNWNKTWGYDFKMYKPLFKFAKEKGLDIVALNTPKKIVRKVARNGLSSLVEEDYEYVPRDVYLDENEYEKLKGILKEAHGHMLRDESAVRRFYEAQSLWNETMAESIVEYLSDNEDKHIFVITGDKHISQKPGIPGRVERRAEKKGLDIKTSIISLEEGDYIVSVKE